LEAPIKRAIVLIAFNLLLRGVQIFMSGDDERKSTSYNFYTQKRLNYAVPEGSRCFSYKLKKIENHLFPPAQITATKSKITKQQHIPHYCK
jgi:hypothetical protein